jgi:hypothetical protein
LQGSWQSGESGCELSSRRVPLLCLARDSGTSIGVIVLPAARFVVTVGALGRPMAGKEDFKGPGFATVEFRPMRWLR